MSWGTPSLLGSNSVSSAHSFSVTGITVSSGLVIVSGAFRASAVNDQIVISDSASNTWTIHYYYPLASVFGEYIAWSYVTNPLSSGSVTLTDTTGSSSFTYCNAYVFGVSGALTPSTEDTSVFATAGAGSSSTIALTSGTPTQAGDLLFAALALNSNTAVYTEDPSWHNLENQQGNTNTLVSLSYFVNSGSSAVTHTPTLNTTTPAYAHMIVGFKVSSAPPPVTATNATMSMMGIG